MPRDIPIIFSGPMVRALLAGRKTMTRRLASSPLRKVQPGDRLWVREGWKPHSIYSHLKPSEMPRSNVFYLADEQYAPSNVPGKPSIHMPRWASRLTLVVTATKVEPLQNISEADAKAEGWPVLDPPVFDDPEINRDAARDWFSDLWEDLHGVESWRSNPDVVAISFKVVKDNIDRIAACP